MKAARVQKIPILPKTNTTDDNKNGTPSDVKDAKKDKNL